MNKVLILTGRELRAFFTTWLGYGVIFAALLMNGIIFNALALGTTPKFSSQVLQDFFHYSSGISMTAALLLAMRMIAEEKQSKSLVLLLASPLTDRQIILGKFLAAFCLFTLMNVLSIYLPLLIFVEGKVSIAQILVGYLGITLIGSAVLAISLYSSALASSQLLAGLLAAGLTIVIQCLFYLADLSASPLKEVLSYAALHNQRFRPFTIGVVHLRDVVYYVSLSFFFIECATRALEGRRLRG